MVLSMSPYGTTQRQASAPSSPCVALALHQDGGRAGQWWTWDGHGQWEIQGRDHGADLFG